MTSGGQTQQQQQPPQGGGQQQQQPTTAVAERNLSTFYNTTARRWIRNSPLAVSNGATMLSALDMEYDRLSPTPLNNFGALAYSNQLHEVYRVASDALLSGVHRQIQHHHINASMGPLVEEAAIASDEQNVVLLGDSIYDDSETEDPDLDDDLLSNDVNPKGTKGTGAGATQNGAAVNGGGADATAAAAAAKATAGVEVKQRKREEAKKRRQEDEQLLRNERKVRDEKNNMMNTIGPFPAPRLSLRMIKTGRAVPSRKTLTQRPIMESDSSDDEEETAAIVAAAPPPLTDDVDSVEQFTQFVSPLSMDSLKKVSESAKVKLRAGSSRAEAVTHIVNAAIKQGCEKACVLMDKNKLLDKVASHAHTTRAHVLAQLASSIPQFLNSLPDHLLQLLGPTLGIPDEQAAVPEMWERIVAMGFCSVLTNLRPRPLRKIGQELNVTLNDSLSTEKHCEAIVFAAFPREQVRIRMSKALKRSNLGVNFVVIPTFTYCTGDMGLIGFQLRNVSMMRNDTDRHYSPEFEFGGLRWSLLCMANKDSLALYLCQQGTVHCKFIITVVNTNNQDDSVYNEGTQRFSSASAENDWGFNNVARFDYLMEPKNGFWDQAKDSLKLSVGIVLVEPIKGKEGQGQGQDKDGKDLLDGFGGNMHHHNGKGLTKAQKKELEKQQKEKEKHVQNMADQLLEQERLETLRKKLKSDISKMLKDEEKQRREERQRWSAGLNSMMDAQKNEAAKIMKEAHDRERKAHLERTREQEKLRQQSDQQVELRRRIEQQVDDNANFQDRKKSLTDELRQMRKDVERVKARHALAQTAFLKSKQLLSQRERILQDRHARLEELRSKFESLPRVPTPPPSHKNNGEDEDDATSGDAATEAQMFTPSNGSGASSVPSVQKNGHHRTSNGVQQTNGGGASNGSVAPEEMAIMQSVHKSLESVLDGLGMEDY